MDDLKDLTFDDLKELDFSSIDTPSKPQIENQNVLGQTFNVPGAAIRSFIQGKGYVEGALNPSKVKKFQDIFIEKAQFTTSPVMNAVLGMPASAAGLALDIATNPADVATILIPMSAPAKAVGKAISSTKVGQKVGAVGNKIFNSDITPIKWVRDFWGNTKKAENVAREAKSAVIKESASKISSVKQEGLRKGKISSAINKKYVDAVNREEDGLKLALENAEKKYTGKISSDSLKKSSEIRKDLPKLYKQKSQEYGEGLNKLLTGKPIQVSKAEVVPTLEEALMNHGILNIDESGRVVIQRSGATRAESTILNEYIKLRNSPDEAMVNVGELLQSQSLIKPDYNKVWSSSEHLQSEVSEGISSIVAQKSPEVAAYRKAYAPFLEWKKAANKEFRPFAGKFENKKGAQILSKYADINKRLTQDESSLITELEGYIGKDYTNNLKSLRKVGREISSRKETIGSISKARGEEITRIANQRKAMIDNEIQSHIDEIMSARDLSIEDIDIETRKVLENIRNRRILVGATAAATAGPSLIRYIKNRLSYQVFGITEK